MLSSVPSTELAAADHAPAERLTLSTALEHAEHPVDNLDAPEATLERLPTPARGRARRTRTSP